MVGDEEGRVPFYLHNANWARSLVLAVVAEKIPPPQKKVKSKSSVLLAPQRCHAYFKVLHK